MTEAQGRRRRRRFTGEGGQLPKRPYRDSAIMYAALAAIVVAVAWGTGGALGRALIFGGGFFLVATSWSWWRFRQRIAAQRLEAKRVEARRGGRAEP
jgi:hypothetical protein